jgi:hypothetical protein
MRDARKMTTAVVVVLLAAATAWAGVVGEVKWSQPPEEVEPGLIYGWDEVSMWPFPIVADDFQCEDPRPVVDVHWWGSYPDYIGGDQIPPVKPKAFVIDFWKDIPVNVDPAMPWSHPGERIWHIWCENFEEELYGRDIDPFAYDDGEVVIVDTCYQYNQKLTTAEYFHQTVGEIYWISIQAVYDASVDPPYPWGWKTRPHHWNDDAVIGHPLDDGAGGIWWDPIVDTTGRSWDMAFELTVPEPGTMILLTLGGLALSIRRRR